MLSPKHLESLVELGVRSYQISLDGPAKIHDLRRTTVNRKSTFDKIYSNLKAFRKLNFDFRILLRVHFDRDTFLIIQDFIEMLNRDLLVDPRYSIVFQPIQKLGGTGDNSLNTMNHIESLTAKEKLESLVKNKDRLLPKSANHVCYAAKANSFVIRADGRVGKCTVALKDERNTIGTINKDGEIAIDKDKILPWLRGLNNIDYETLSCPLSNFK